MSSNNNIYNRSRVINRVKTAKGRTVSSQHWLRRHINDPYVVAAKKTGYRSRAAYKLLEIEEKYRIIAKVPRGCSILDLGCAPGSWLQVLSEFVTVPPPPGSSEIGAVVSRDQRRVIGIDLQSTEPVPHTEQLIGDFTAPQSLAKLSSCLAGSSVGLILSDMAAVASGNKDYDQRNMERIIRHVLNFAEQHLIRRGNLVCKMLNGHGTEELIARAKTMFSTVRLFKPKASYKDSAEMFLICLGKRAECATTTGS